MLPREYRHQPEILPVAGRLFLKSAQKLCHATDRGLGMWRVVHEGARVFRGWRDCPIEGPDGKPFWIDLRDGGFAWLVSGYRTISLEPSLTRLAPDAVALDIGANIGTVTRLLSGRLPNGQVYAFEPSPDNFRRLARNCAEIPNVNCERRALGATTGKVAFSSDDIPSDLRSMRADGNGSSSSVDCVRLDDWCRENNLRRLDLIKIDVEGFEEDVLVPAEEVLRRFRPVVIFEYIWHFAEQRSAYKGKALFPLFERLGYKVRRLDQLGREATDMTSESGTHEYLTNDFIAIPANPAAAPPG